MNSPEIAPLQLASEQSRLMQSHQFLSVQYAQTYPGITLQPPARGDENTITIVSITDNELVNGTGRVVIDSGALPDELLFGNVPDKLRRTGRKLAEIGRFAIEDSRSPLVKQFYRAFWQTCRRHHVDDILIIVKHKDVKFHENIIGASLLIEDIGQSFGSSYTFSAMLWPVNQTKSRFFNWCGAQVI
ncbi:MAG: N-acyl amino acid synthase FeeM domain-containing protein [Pseudomonadales bacterium]